MLKNRKNSMLAMATAVVMVLLSAGMSFAEPPLITEEAETLDKGEMQFELTGEFSLDEELVNEVKVEEREAELEASYLIGVVDDLELELAMPYEWVREKETSVAGQENFRAHGYGDVDLEMKWRFYNEDDLSFAVKPSVLFPTGNADKELGAGRISYGLMLVGSKEFDPLHLELHANAGIMHYNYQASDERTQNRSNIWHVSVAATKRIAKGLTACGDLGMEANPDRTSNTKPAFILAGFIYSITKNADVSFGVKFGLTKPEPDLAILPGLVWKF